MKLVHYPHPALRHPAKPVTIVDKQIQHIIGRLTELMYEHRGVGLAAPQIGVPYQIFVMNPEADPQNKEAEWVMINPVISNKSGSVEGEEGCLSFPGLYQKVRRAQKIRVQGFDPQGKSFDRELSDLLARIVQHETDHLHGRLFIDYFNPVGRIASKTALAAFERDYRRDQEKKLLPSNKEILRQLRAMEEELAQRTAQSQTVASQPAPSAVPLL